MSLTTHCAYCSTAITYEAENVGAVWLCPSCQARVTLPPPKPAPAAEPFDIARLPAAPSQTPAINPEAADPVPEVAPVATPTAAPVGVTQQVPVEELPFAEVLPEQNPLIPWLIGS